MQNPIASIFSSCFMHLTFNNSRLVDDNAKVMKAVINPGVQAARLYNMTLHTRITTELMLQ